MKYISIAAAIIVCAAACRRASMPVSTPLRNREIVNANGQRILAGHASPAMLRTAEYSDWFDRSWNSYRLDTITAKQLRPLVTTQRMDIFLGTWCGDSRREVPRMLKLLSYAGMDSNRVHLVFVDNTASHYKQSPEHEERGRNIHHVPTFIVYDGNKETGRIIESPVVSLEKDLLAILTGAGYEPTYRAVSYWIRHAKNRQKQLSDTALYDWAKRLQPLTNGFGEFNAYATMCKAAGDLTEAVNAFIINTRLYPQNTTAYANLAECLAMAGRKPEAVRAYENLLALSPGNEQALQRIAALRRGE